MTDMFDKIKASKLGMMIFSPDAIKSNIVGHIINKIEQETDLKNTGQMWYQHDDFSIIKFYQNSIPDNIQHLHLIQKLFADSKVLITFWEGEDVFTKLLKIKGSSHPSDAKAGTIRSGFYCDNSITNLVHTSDDANEMIRELAILDITKIDSLIYKFEKPTDIEQLLYHNGGYRLLQALKQHIEISGLPISNLFDITLSGDMDARKTFKTMQSALEQLEQTSEDKIVKDLVQSFLSGEIEKLNQLLLFIKTEVSAWDRMVIESSAIGINKWSRLGLDDVIQEIHMRLNDFEYVVSGSVALYLNDVPVKPNDIDLWCTEDTLISISESFNLDIVKHTDGHYEASKITLRVNGWDVEIVGNVVLHSGLRLSVDEAMINDSKNRVESTEDVLSEMIALNRGTPKNDLLRVLNIASTTNINYQKMLDRLSTWKINLSILTLLEKVNAK